eukprot:TRINITY_DN4391_c0_g1_i6.p2 TRINITY_DN4391_c0_g1~~TRINITY_DN4391_c0_g1_i6.p2  ORF type:complete len:304 (-),score=34.77 TRINITY_DN4391_c0_g1_i6:4066-4977(-)
MAEAPAVVEPVFILNKLLPMAAENSFSVAEICSAAEKTSGHGTVEGAQRLGGLWRIYPTTIDARVGILSRGIVLRGHSVQPRDRNPFLIRDNNGTEREVAAVKVIVGNVPMSYKNTDIAKAMEQRLNVKIQSNVMDEKDRVDGKLTRWKTGRRFVFIEPPTKPLPKSLQIGAFRASIYHRDQTPKQCARCLAKTHRTHECTSDVRCRVCLELGHVSGAEVCSLAPRAPMQPLHHPHHPHPTRREKNRGRKIKRPQSKRRWLFTHARGSANLAQRPPPERKAKEPDQYQRSARQHSTPKRQHVC